ncbi:hypothetical protein [Coraliomargarita akajimensis]|uniref:Uncharacterized protein n=1 Tax=Coraliomargarita akajimensis (strain DSM 45221 / IAM 15411 / JCM 23193 / KCTC 12865 / 04OKA010-24) TaxID=583355 RepID=D5EI57_CORAD|nr:hypothetical protein [Coraliomargarita akajimensis]ADE56097.1 conserved hypothetical protein [Coraliomargarita akajimensis DSM 45221]
MLWDLLQQNQIEKNRRELDDARREQTKSWEVNYDIQEQISKLSLVTQAVWSFLKEKYNLDEIDLMNRIEELDMLDGVKDGKVTAVAHSCLGCGKRISTKYKTCIYCDAPNHKFSPFTEINSKKTT